MGAGMRGLAASVLTARRQLCLGGAFGRGASIRWYAGALMLRQTCKFHSQN
jgi:hypothetical protein